MKRPTSPTANSLRDFLKARLKKKKMTYSALSAKLDVAEVTVKRWMTSHDMSLSAVIRICEVLEINPLSLFDKSLAQDGLGSPYSESQEAYFARHKVEFLIFIKALVGFSFDEIKERTGKTVHSLIRSLREMEKVDVLRLEQGNRIRVLIRGPFRWRPGGPLDRALFPAFRETLFAHFRRYSTLHDMPNEDDITLFRPFELYLDPAAAKEMSLELAMILRKYRSLTHSRYDRRHNVPVAGIIAVDQFDAWAATCLG